MEILLDRAPHLSSAICFHAQQASEKALKALVAATGREPPWSHDLVSLIVVLREAGVVVGASPRDCELLTPFATISRYPRRSSAESVPVPTAVDACRRIVAAVDVVLGS